MARRAAVNTRVSAVVDYLPDPRGWGMFEALSGIIQRQHTGSDGGRRIPGNGAAETSFYGYAANPNPPVQGMAPLGQGRILAADASSLSEERSGDATTDPALAIFAQRMKRRGTW